MASYKNKGGPGGSGGFGATGYYAARGAALLSLSSFKSVGWEFTDWAAILNSGTPPGWRKSAVGSGTGLPDVAAGAKGGRISMASGVTLSSSITYDTATPVISNISTEKWYFVTRQKINAQDAASVCASGLLNVASNKLILAGHIRALTPTNFGVSYDGLYAGSALDLAVARDTADHVIEVYCLGDDILRARIDEGAEVSATMASEPTDPVYPYIEVSNGAVATSRILNTDLFGIMFPR